LLRPIRHAPLTIFHFPVPISRQTLDRYYPPGRRVAARLYGMIRAQLPADAVVLDLGAGGSVAPDRRLKEHAAKVCGVDVDPIVLDNPDVHEGKLLRPDGTIPYPDVMFDAALSDYVFEHLPDPARTLREVHRVLRPGGRYYFRTINRRHYLSVISRLMPRKHATKLADVLGHQPQDAAKTHETFFRLNSVGQVRRSARAAGFEVEQLTTLETHPVYFQLVPPLWYVMVGVERVMNKLPVFAPVRMAIFGCLIKPSAEPPEGGDATDAFPPRAKEPA
jgi:SAM-dependent methyltransferase